MSESFAGAARDPEAMALMRRRALAQSLMQGATQSTPMRTAAGPWSALAQALAGGVADVVTEGRERDLYDTRRTEANEFMAQALGGLTPGQGSAPRPPTVPGAPMAPPGGGFTPGAMATQVRLESNGDDNARNPRSSATGRHQFIDSTWLDFARENPQHFQGATTPQEILSRRTDGALQDQAAQWYAQRNAPVLQAAGQPVNDTTLALAHRFGPQGATQVLGASPETPIAQVVGEAVMRANPDLAGRTVGQVTQRYASQFGGAAPAPAGQQPAPTGQPPAAAAGLNREAMVMHALRGMQSTNPEIRRQAQMLMQAAQALPQTPQRSFTTAAPGAALVDNQGNVVGQIPERPSDAQRDQARWRELAALGQNATPQQAQERDILARRIGGAGVNVQNVVETRAETAEAGRRGTSLGDEGDRVRLAAETAAMTIDSIQQVRALGASTDRLAGAREVLGGYLDALGVPASQSRLVRDASTLQAFNAAANNIVLGRQMEQRGVQTDGDREVMRRTFATITNTNEANDVILRATEAQADRMIERAEFYRQWRMQPNADGRPRNTLDGASEAWTRHIRETPLVARTGSGMVFFNEWLPAALQNPQINGDREAALRLWRENARQRR
jgi:hypothetical protein